MGFFLVLALITPLFVPALSLDAQFGSENQNSQNISILETETVDPKLARGGGDVFIDGSALIPEGEVGFYEVSEPTSDTISLYVVREGDTIEAVAKMFGVSANTIRWANNIPLGTGLRVGQSITILPVTGVVHVAQKGDTFSSIAKRYGADAEDIASFNGLENSTLAIGTKLIIPDGEFSAVPSAKSPTKSFTSGLSKIAGYFIKPVNGRKTQGLHGYMHNAVDIGAPIGSPVWAMADGTVLVASIGGYHSGYGNYVVIGHPNGTQTLYAHLADETVSVGDRVSQGQIIGHVGMTGKTTGPHAHVEVRGAANPL